MIPLTRRQFLERAALVAGAAAYRPSSLRASAASTGNSNPVAVSGISPSAFSASVAHRTAAARQRIARAAAFIRETHPELRAQILADADDALRGRLLLPGNSALSSVGNPPDWLTPRYGDEEYLWSLNRMAHWKTLLRAHALTGDPRYAEKVVAELNDWIARAAPPDLRHSDGTPNPDAVGNAGPPPWRSLEAGIRMYDTWPTVLEHLAGTAFLPPDRLLRIAASVAQHGEVLSLLTPLLWPDANHNHFFMEMLGLLSIGVYYRELPDAPRWTGQAVHELQRCVQKQFTPDGGHVEAVPSYHNLCVVLLARFLRLAHAAEQELPAEFQRVLALAADQTLHSTRPTGTVVPWGDSTQRENHVEAALRAYTVTHDPGVLQTLARLVGEDHFRSLCAPVLWDVDDPAAVFAWLERPVKTRPLVRFDRGNDQVMLRTAWTRDALSVFFSCHSPLLPGSGHQHIDLGGFDFTAYGQPLVVDPGVFTYRESEDRRIFKSAAWHSVLTVDGRDPFDYVNRWRYTPQKEGRVTSVRDDPDHVRVASFHRNYEPVLCRRVLALLDRRLLVVLDVVDALAPSSTVQIYFHLDSTQVAWSAANARAVTADDDVRLLLATSTGLDGECLPGRVSEKFDIAHPSTRIRLSDRGGAPRRVYATVLAPFRAGDPVPVIEKLSVSPDMAACSFVCAGRTYRVAADE